MRRRRDWLRLGGSYFELSTVTEVWSKGWEVTAWRMPLTQLTAEFAAAHPERVESLILFSGYATLRVDADYPDGVDQAHVDQIASAILNTWGTGAAVDVTNPTMAGDGNFRRWWAQMERVSASPATAAAMARQLFDVDVRSGRGTRHRHLDPSVTRLVMEELTGRCAGLRTHDTVRG